MASTEHRDREGRLGASRIDPTVRATLAVALSAVVVTWAFGPWGLLVVSVAAAIGVATSGDLGLPPLGPGRGHAGRGGPARRLWPREHGRLDLVARVQQHVPRWMAVAVAAVAAAGLVGWLLGPLALLAVVAAAGLGFTGHRLVRILAVPVDDDGQRPATSAPWSALGALPWRRPPSEARPTGRRLPSWPPTVPFRSRSRGPHHDGAAAPAREHRAPAAEPTREGSRARLSERARPQGGTAGERLPRWVVVAVAAVAAAGLVGWLLGPVALLAVVAAAGLGVAGHRLVRILAVPVDEGGARPAASPTPRPAASPPPRPGGDLPDRRYHPDGDGAGRRLPSWLPTVLSRSPSGGPGHDGVPERDSWVKTPELPEERKWAREWAVLTERANQQHARTPGAPAWTPGDHGPGTTEGDPPPAPAWSPGDHTRRIDHRRAHTAPAPAVGDGAGTRPAPARPESPSGGPPPRPGAGPHAASATGWDRQATRPFQRGPAQSPAWRQAPAPPPAWRQAPAPGARQDGGGADWMDRLERVPRGCLVAGLVAIGLWFAFWSVVLVLALYVLLR